MKYVLITSKGSMALEAITLIGASTKRGDDSKIGMFGSGLKYAIASMLRQNISFTIFTDEKEIKITTEPVEFGGKTFNKIMVNGKDTSFTDSMGTEDWEGIFPFIREIYSNALDEGDATIEIVDIEKPIPMQGMTCFYIEANRKLSTFLAVFSQYFLDYTTALWSGTDHDHIYSPKGENTKVYRKGILVYTSNSKPLFAYNLENLTINESRVAKYSWEVTEKVAKLLESCTDKRIIRRWFDGIKNANSGYFEHNCIANAHDTLVGSKEFVEVIMENSYYPIEIGYMLPDEDKLNRMAMPNKLLQRFLAYVPDLDVVSTTTKNASIEDAVVEVKPSMRFFNNVTDALDIIKSTDYGTYFNPVIKFVKFKSYSKRYKIDSPRAERPIISLSVRLDSDSVEELVATLITINEVIQTAYDENTTYFSQHIVKLFAGKLVEEHKNK